MSVGGVSWQKRNATSMDRYGVTNAMKSNKSKEKRKKTCLERYGVEHVAQAPSTRQKTRNTLKERYGVDVNSTSQIKEIKERQRQTYLSRSDEEKQASREKKIQTCVERYGVTSVMHLQKVKDRKDQTCLELYGDKCATRSPAIKEKTMQTVLKRYGVAYPMMNPDVKKRMIHSLKQNDLQEVAQRRLNTMKLRGSFQKSRAEEKFYSLLLTKFTSDDIERNSRPLDKPWPIDFYIKSLDLWIQIDGVYWHGLDRPLQEHRDSTNDRSKIILYKNEVDQRQMAWFHENNMSLLRITDQRVKELSELPEDLRELAYFVSFPTQSERDQNTVVVA